MGMFSIDETIETSDDEEFLMWIRNIADQRLQYIRNEKTKATMCGIATNNQIDPTVMLYSPDDNEVGLICNMTALDDVRLQIFRQNLAGYYIVYKGEKIHIDSRGNLEKWPEGCFDYVIKAAGEMLDVSVSNDTP